MLAVHCEEMKSSSLVQAPEAQPVLCVYCRLIEGQHLLVLTRPVELKVGRLLGLHNVILVEHHHHEVNKVLDPRLELRVPLLYLIVDWGEEVRSCMLIILSNWD